VTSRPSSSARGLTIPVRDPFGARGAGGFRWLSPGQFAVLMHLRRRMRHNRGVTTLAAIAAATGGDPGTVTHRLDRLASLGLIGRRSTRGRFGSTRFWPPRRRSSANVVTPTPFGRFSRAYVRREDVRRIVERTGRPLTPASPQGSAGESPGRWRRVRPPRLMWERCPEDGRSVRLARWRWTWTSARFVGVWDGECPRCHRVIVAPIVVDLPPRDRRPVPAGPILAAIAPSGGRPGASSSVDPVIPGYVSPAADSVSPARQDAARSFLELLRDQDQRAAIGVRYLGWTEHRDSHPLDLTGLPAEAAELRLAAWDAGLRSVRVRYSQPGDVAIDPDSSVRDSQPAVDVDDGHARGPRPPF
jgi:hypothetical protein